jgi:hypothetical protein
MFPEYRRFHEYRTDSEATLTEYLFEEYKDVVSEAQAEFVWAEAYDRRHSAGLEEVYCEFVSLLRIIHKVREMQD